jgi:hypothetical protein
MVGYVKVAGYRTIMAQFSSISGLQDSLTYMYYTSKCNKTVYLCFHSLPVPMAARITKYLNKYVRTGLCLIYMSYVKVAGCRTIMAQFSSTSGLQDSLTYMYYTSKCLYMSLLYKYIFEVSCM